MHHEIPDVYAQLFLKSILKIYIESILKIYFEKVDE